MLSEVTVNQHTGEITFDGITASVRDVKIDIKEEKKCKILTITYNNQEYVCMEISSEKPHIRTGQNSR